MAITTNVNVSDEEPIKNRLLHEGDSGSDERRIIQLMRAFYHLCQNGEKSTKSLEDENVDLIIANIELSHHRASIIEKMNEDEQKYYENLCTEVKNNIAEVKQEISCLREELKEARKICRNRLEYDALGKKILQYPDREGMENEIKELEKELATVRERETEVDREIEWRKTHFKVLLNVIHGLSIERKTNYCTKMDID